MATSTATKRKARPKVDWRTRPFRVPPWPGYAAFTPPWPSTVGGWTAHYINGLFYHVVECEPTQRKTGDPTFVNGGTVIFCSSIEPRTALEGLISMGSVTRAPRDSSNAPLALPAPGPASRYVELED